MEGKKKGNIKTKKGVKIRKVGGSKEGKKKNEERIGVKRGEKKRRN